ncbi:hypothetical protein OH77DRAFT_1517802 [Trametes cingulata]|nr:hypothetical protein OH77DRAFT_1517802 [Trametes cingulata]
MCWKRMEQRVWKACGDNRIDWVQVHCSAVNCKLSPTHPVSCQGLQCVKSCHQSWQTPERAPIWEIHDFCPGCKAAGYSLS